MNATVWNPDTLNAPPRQGPCPRCRKDLPVFDTPRDVVPKQLCADCWSAFREAREAGTFVDWSDAFDNASDEQLSKGLGWGAR